MISEATTLEFQQDEFETDLHGVRAAGPTDETLAVQIVRLAFASDPIARWTFPDAAVYMSIFPGFIRAFAGKAFESATAYVTADNDGTALWLPPETEPDEEAVGRILDAVAPALIKKDLFAIFDQMGEFHPKEPHWYLPIIAVDPSRQGRGAGTRLLRHALERCDADGVPAYLESSNPKNITLYQRFGFEIIGIIRSGGSPPMFPMLRNPQAQGL